MNRQGLIFQNRDELLCFDIERIVCIMADGNYSRIVTNVNLLTPTQVGTNLAGIEEVLNRFFRHKKHNFVRICRKYIINLDYVFCISTRRKKLILTDFNNVIYTISDIPVTELKALKNIVAEFKYKQ